MKKLQFHKKVFNFISSRVDEVGGQYLAFGLFGLFNYPIFYLIWLDISPQPYESLILRSIATLLCLGLVLKNKWPVSMKRFLPVYWYVTLTYCLPFFFTFMLLKNHFDNLWYTNAIVVIFFLMLLVDALSFAVLQTVGVILGVLFFFILGNQWHGFGAFNVWGALITYFVSIIIGAIFAHNKQVLVQARVDTMKNVGASIAHELRTPLFSIGATTDVIDEAIPKLAKGYELAKSNGLPVPALSERELKEVVGLPKRVHRMVNSAMKFINMFITKVNVGARSKISSQDLKELSMVQCVQEALDDYPFTMDERNKVHFDSKNDFEFMGNAEYMSHVLFNLIKNALYFMKAAQKGEISIWLEKGERFNQLYFKDTGKGIPKNLVPYVFNSFVTSETRHGTGIGLAFCKTVVKEFGGNIECESVFGEYAHFIIRLPQIHKIQTA